MEEVGGRNIVNTAEVQEVGRRQARSFKQRVSDFFMRSTRSDFQTSTSKGNLTSSVSSERCDHKFVCEDDIQVSIEKKTIIGETKTARDRQILRDVFHAYMELGNRGSQPKNAAVPFQVIKYTKEHRFMTSALIEIFNNVPNLHEVCSEENESDRSSEDKNGEVPSQNDVKYAVGRIVFTGSFNLKVLDKIGGGFQATIFEVEKNSRRYAAKVIKDHTYTQYIQDEYDVLSTLNHDNIIAIYDQIPDGFVMDIVPSSLYKHIKNNSENVKTTLKLPGRDQITTGLLKAVSYLHDNNIAHLDIKPDNILIASNGEPKLADFGFALRIRDEDGQLHSLQAPRGTLPYMSPELLDWRDDNIMTAIDAWAVGIVMFAILTGGKIPFGRNSATDVFREQAKGIRLPLYLKQAIWNDASHFKYFCVVLKLLKFQQERRLSIDTALSLICPPT